MLFILTHRYILIRYRAIAAQTVRRHFVTAETYWRNYSRDHSTDQSGAQGEDTPSVLRLFKQLWEFQESMPNASVRAEAERQERRDVERSITGAMAPLGPTVRHIRDETQRDDVDDVLDPSDDPAEGTIVTERVRTGIARRREEPQEMDPTTPVRSRPRFEAPAQRPALDPPRRRPVRRATVPSGRFDPSATGDDDHIRSFGRSNMEIIDHVRELHETLILPPPPPPRTFTEVWADIVSVHTVLSTATDPATVNRCNTALRILDREMSSFEYAI